MSQLNPTLAYSLLTLAALFWTGNWIAGRMLADLVPPSALTFWRWAIALALLMPFVGPRLWAARALLAREWRPIVALGLLGGGLHNVLQYWGLQYTLATNGAILNATTPVLIIVLGTLVFREPFPRRAAAGAVIALAGALALITRLDFPMLLAVGPNRGDLLILISMVMLSAYTVGLRRRPAGLDALSFLACFAIVALVPGRDRLRVRARGGQAHRAQCDLGRRHALHRGLPGVARLSLLGHRRTRGRAPPGRACSCT